MINPPRRLLAVRGLTALRLLLQARTSLEETYCVGALVVVLLVVTYVPDLVMWLPRTFGFAGG